MVLMMVKLSAALRVVKSASLLVLFSVGCLVVKTVVSSERSVVETKATWWVASLVVL